MNKPTLCYDEENSSLCSILFEVNGDECVRRVEVFLCEGKCDLWLFQRSPFNKKQMDVNETQWKELGGVSYDYNYLNVLYARHGSAQRNCWKWICDRFLTFDDPTSQKMEQVSKAGAHNDISHTRFDPRAFGPIFDVVQAQDRYSFLLRLACEPKIEIACTSACMLEGVIDAMNTAIADFVHSEVGVKAIDVRVSVFGHVLHVGVFHPSLILKTWTVQLTVEGAFSGFVALAREHVMSSLQDAHMNEIKLMVRVRDRSKAIIAPPPWMAEQKQDVEDVISGEPIVFPVRLHTGHLFDLESIVSWLKKSDRNPLTGLPLLDKTLWPVEDAKRLALSPPEATARHEKIQAHCVFVSALPFVKAEEEKKNYQDEKKRPPLLLSTKDSVARWRFANYHSDHWFNLSASAERAMCEAFFQFPKPKKDLLQDQQLERLSFPMSSGLFPLTADLSRRLSLKEVSFRETVFPRLVCNITFSNCNLSDTDMRTTLFYNCFFVGKKTVFVRAKINSETRFVHCKVEHATFPSYATCKASTFVALWNRGLHELSLDNILD